MSRIVLLCLLCFSAVLLPSMYAAARGPGMVAEVDPATQAAAEQIIHAAHADGAISMVRLSGPPADGAARLCLRFWDEGDRAEVQAALRAAGVRTDAERSCGGALINPDRWHLASRPARPRA